MYQEVVKVATLIYMYFFFHGATASPGPELHYRGFMNTLRHHNR